MYVCNTKEDILKNVVYHQVLIQWEPKPKLFSYHILQMVFFCVQGLEKHEVE